MSKFTWKDSNKPLYILAPMANITTLPFRSICKEFGADVVFTPMLSSNAIIHNTEKTLKIAEYLPDEQPVIVQIFGYDGDLIAKAAVITGKALKPAGIDLNMGCPAPKITGNECGSALLKDYDSALEIAKMVREKFSGQLSVKLRLGWNDFDITNFVLQLEKIGIDAVTIHGRTAKQGYRGESDWEKIKEISDKLRIPVIGNGDIDTWESAKEKVAKYAPNGVMIGRKALTRPWIFKEIKEERTIDFAKSDIADLILKQTKLHIEYFEKEQSAVKEMRKFMGWYLKGFKGAHELRREAMLADSLSDVKHILSRLQKIS